MVGHEPWAGDFSTPRNRALELATGDWILSLDVDERLAGDFDAAREHLGAAAETVAFRVRFVPQVGWTPVRELRIWRRRDDIRFHGRIHETVLPGIAAVARDHGYRIDSFDHCTVHRVREGGDAATRARDEPLLDAELARHPDRAAVYDHLARVYEASGDGERAIETWKRGVTVARGRNCSRPDDRVLYVDLIQHLLARGVIDDQLAVLVNEARRAFDPTPTIELAAARSRVRDRSTA